MAADQSAEFGRWTAASNVDGLLLDQIQADIADLAVRYLAAPPARLFAELVRGRNTLFDMITNGRQAPRLTMRLYQAAAQVCAMLAHASADLGVGQAAMTQCRVALRCAEYAEHAALTGYIAWVQSNVLYWEGKHDAAAQLVSTALGSTSALGTARLRLASQLARIEAGAIVKTCG